MREIWLNECERVGTVKGGVWKQAFYLQIDWDDLSGDCTHGIDIFR